MIPRPPTGKSRHCDCRTRIEENQRLFLSGCEEAALEHSEQDVRRHSSGRCSVQCKSLHMSNVALLHLGLDDFHAALSCYDAVIPEHLPADELFRYRINHGVLLAVGGKFTKATQMFRQARKEGGDAEVADHNIKVVQRLQRRTAAQEPQRTFSMFYAFELSSSGLTSSEEPQHDEPPRSLTPNRIPIALCTTDDFEDMQPANDTGVVECDVDRIVGPFAVVKDMGTFDNTHRYMYTKLCRHKLPQVVQQLLVPHQNDPIRGAIFDCSNVHELDWTALSNERIKELLQSVAVLHDAGLSLNGDVNGNTTLLRDGRIAFIPVFDEEKVSAFEEDIKTIRKLLSQRVETNQKILHLLNSVKRLASSIATVLEEPVASPAPSVSFSPGESVELLHAMIRPLVTEDAAHISVSREGCVEELAFYFASLQGQGIFRPLRVAFAQEHAVDGGNGGVCNELFRVFTEQACSELLNSTLSSELAVGFGSLIIKSCIDERCFAAGLPLAFYEALCGVVPSVQSQWNALATIDDVLFRSLQLYLVDGSTDCEELVDELCPTAQSGDRHSLVLNRLYDLTIGRRLAALKSVRHGMERFMGLIPELVTKKFLTNPHVLRAAFEGSTELTGREVVQNLEFRGWDAKDSTPFYLCCWIHAASGAQLRTFLRFCTGSNSIPVNGFKKRVVVFRCPERLAAQTCFSQVNMPPFSTSEELADAMNAAMTVVDASPEMHADDAL